MAAVSSVSVSGSAEESRADSWWQERLKDGLSSLFYSIFDVRHCETCRFMDKIKILWKNAQEGVTKSFCRIVSYSEVVSASMTALEAAAELAAPDASTLQKARPKDIKRPQP